jgi:hypothetical protein
LQRGEYGGKVLRWIAIAALVVGGFVAFAWAGFYGILVFLFYAGVVGLVAYAAGVATDWLVRVSRRRFEDDARRS